MFIKNNKRNYSVCYDGITTVLICEVAVLALVEGKYVVRNLKGFWDTGSSNSVISKRVVEQLGLPVYKDNNITTSVTGNNRLNSYRINVFLNNEMKFENIEIFAADMKELDYEFVIGMDIIQQGNLIIKNNKKTTLKFKKVRE